MAKTPEGDVKEKTDKVVKRSWPGCYRVTPTTGGYGHSGEFDRIFCYEGMFLGREDKRDEKDLTELQKDRAIALLKAGGAYASVNRIALDSGAFEAWLRDLPSNYHKGWRARCFLAPGTSLESKLTNIVTTEE